ncbi:MAG TPA: hypothetical protein V6D07_06115 [Trichocoleus sp.]
MSNVRSVVNADLHTVEQSTISQYSGISKLNFIKRWIAQGCEWLMSSLINNSELQVYQDCYRNGDTQWIIHNPATGKRVFFSSEQEALIWIESRYLK